MTGRKENITEEKKEWVFWGGGWRRMEEGKIMEENWK